MTATRPEVARATRTVFAGELPPAIQDWLDERRRLGQDHHDEEWEGEYHVAPLPHGRHANAQEEVARCLDSAARGIGLRPLHPINVGRQHNYRAPDRVYIRTDPNRLYHEGPAIVVEVLSPGDESFNKFGFYFDNGVEEVLIVDPDGRTTQWFTRGDDGFVEADASALLGTSSTELTASIDWV